MLSWLQEEAKAGREALKALRSRAFGLAKKTGAAILIALTVAKQRFGNVLRLTNSVFSAFFSGSAALDKPRGYRVRYAALVSQNN